MPPLTLIIGNKNYSSWSLRAWLALKQTGAEFEEIRIPLDTPQTRSQILQHSPTGKVPALRHGEILLWESSAICEYLAELFPDRHLWPAEPRARAIARCVSAEMHAGFSPLRQRLSMDCRSRFAWKGAPPDVQADIDRILTLWFACRQEFGEGGDFLFGHWTIADAMFAPVVSRFVTYGVPLDAIAQAYAEATLGLPAMQEWLIAAAAETEVLVDH
ncbi:MAG: glutathione S-transferase family protein [Drouetiella hepatica Uher 2000/2452]|jgi:glutathione S-transferase|uniref:Glutathione S-transferase family protein n=1 Tax=Drouetiella hepatica Uher 2000/2452 TaxID=904376 RepID=A0A951QC52_9CYAN|nr:glutathione S-transferase family protein [Drouetiella hepatica Uher 2000/2452]